MSKYGATFEPVNPDQLLQDSNKIILGDMSLTLLHHRDTPKDLVAIYWMYKMVWRSIVY